MTLPEIVLQVLPDPHVRFTPDLRDKVRAEAKKHGKDPSDASMIQAVSAARKVVPESGRPPAPPATPPSEASPAVERTKRAYKRRSPIVDRKPRKAAPPAEPIENAGETYQSLLNKLQACMDQVLQENAEMKQRLAAIAAAAAGTKEN